MNAHLSWVDLSIKTLINVKNELDEISQADTISDIEDALIALDRARGNLRREMEG